MSKSPTFGARCGLLESEHGRLLLNIAGLLMNLIGVILLFRYGMPNRVRTGGGRLPADPIYPAAISRERRGGL
jgi:hypothetical protein